MNVYAILMAGGVGTRFWPRSRTKMPKQVLNIVAQDTMIQETSQRLNGLVDKSKVLIVTNNDQKIIIQQQLPHLSEENFILEPFGRNTAPCIGLAAIHLSIQDPDTIMVVMPADHLIANVEEFKKEVQLAIDFVKETNALVTLGITPHEPATGYGYIQSGEEVFKKNGKTICEVRTFAEKPNRETAKRFLESGDFFWNSGMFIWKASTILKEIGEKLPDIYEHLMEVKASIHQQNYQSKLEDMYRSIRGISIDFGVMQNAKKVYVVPTDMGWNDVGSWETVYDMSSKDKYLNTGEYHELINVDSQKCYIYSPDKLVALVGVKDLIIVDTDDALLICKKSDSQRVKEAVEAIKKKGSDKWL